MAVKNVVILGSTGSIGVNTLKVIERFPRRFRVIGLSAYNNLRCLEKQIERFSPSWVAVSKDKVVYLKRHLAEGRIKVFNVNEDVAHLIEHPAIEVVVIGMRGAAALTPFLKAARAGKTIAPANKEALVMAGDILIREAKRHNARIIPVDSEQSAIFQCLEGRDKNELKGVYLTASGGALRKVKKSLFAKISLKEVLSHPRWKMGKKITVDSATLMNKGFEVIEAHRLFEIPLDKIQVIIHPEAIIHSMVEFQDGAVLAQLGIPDMRLPIQYALTYPERMDSGIKRIDFLKVAQLTFEKPDQNKFPALRLAMHAGRQGGTLPCVLNAANEEAVEAFLMGRINFSKIYDVVEKVVRNHTLRQNPDLSDILAADQWAREEARRILY